MTYHFWLVLYLAKNQLSIKNYESLVSEKYKEPVEGRFEDATAAFLRGLRSGDEDEDLDSDSNSRNVISNYPKFQFLILLRVLKLAFLMLLAKIAKFSTRN